MCWKLPWALASAVLFVSLSASAAPLKPEQVPTSLRSWVPWVLEGAPLGGCPLTSPKETEPHCVWPGALALDVTETGARFTQTLEVWSPSFVPLPGDTNHAPIELNLDATPIVALPSGADDSVAGLWLAPGTHRITGRFIWASLPESLVVPLDVGIVTLRLSGREIPFPRRDGEGRLWFHDGNAAEEASAKLQVFRKLTDEIPFQVETRIVLDLSGKSRELHLKPALLAGFVPMALSGDLPAKLEPDGTLRVQARTGHYQLILTARATPAEAGGPPAALALPETAGEAPWPENEFWSFEALPSLRSVRLEGAPSIEPSQTEIPAEWRQLPAFLLKAGASLSLVEEQRGDPGDSPDELALNRILWLDFDGNGFTTFDSLSGSVTRPGRLELLPPGALGRANLNGVDRLVTRSDAGGLPGIEVPRGRLLCSAESRLEGSLRALPAVGWDRDFKKVSAELHLPPGWRFFSATGVDRAPDSWFSFWQSHLHYLFLALALAAAIGKLWGVRWGLLAAAAFALTFPEVDAPQWLWLPVVAIEPIVRLLPANRLHFVARALRLVLQIGLVLTAIVFLYQDVRGALYPALAAHGYPNPSEAFRDEQSLSEAPTPAPPSGERAEHQMSAKRSRGSFDVLSGSVSSEALEFDPRAKVQTGPGIPSWQWNSVSLQWSGPVGSSQQLHLWLLSPAANRVLAFARLLLLGLLLLRLLLGTRPWHLKIHPSTVVAAALLVAFALPTGARAQPDAGAGEDEEENAASPKTPRAPQAPPSELLAALRQKLLAPPDCAPNCVALETVTLDVSPSGLRLELVAGALATSEFPLPGNAQHWLPTKVLVDGKPASALRRTDEGTLVLALPPGTHHLVLEGKLPPRDAIQLALPLPPRRVVPHLSGFTLAGVHADGAIDGMLELTRIPGGGTDGETGTSETRESAPLPPFLKLTRTLTLGLTWRVETTLTRETPPGLGVTAEVPLLPGESVTTGGIRVEEGKVLASLPPGATELKWSSLLATTPALPLTAARGQPYSEVWRLAASPDWHIEHEGIPPIRPAMAPEAAGEALEWRPWPGERVTLTIERPSGIDGQTITIDRSHLTVAPGLRASSFALEIHLRASQGGERVFTLPEGTRLESLTVNGLNQPTRQSGRDVTVSIAPGESTLLLKTQTDPHGLAAFYRVPEISLGGPSVNSQVDVQIPTDRWILFVGGPRLGPAVRLWSYLLVLIALAFGLARFGGTPLKTRHWILLGLGLCQIPMPIAAIIVGWLLVLGYRERYPDLPRPLLFKARQLLLIAWTFLALGLLIYAIQRGLLGYPEMQIAGNGSTSETLRWFADRTAGPLPTPWVLSVPISVYRIAMLLWSAWLALAVLRWLKFGYRAFLKGGAWRAERNSP